MKRLLVHVAVESLGESTTYDENRNLEAEAAASACCRPAVEAVPSCG